jgi:hypothetical protein
MRPGCTRVALVWFGFVAATCSLLAQRPLPSAASAPVPAPIGPNMRRVPPGMTYHRVWIISPLVGSGKVEDPRRPLLVPAPVAPNAKPTALLGASTATASATAPAAATAQTGLLGFQMQLSDDGQYALAELVFVSPLAFQTALKNEVAARNISVAALPATTAPAAVSGALETALQSAVPGLQIFERGQATQAQIQAAFQQKKASFTFSPTNSVRP